MYVDVDSEAQYQIPVAEGGDSIPIHVPVDRTADVAKEVDDQSDVQVQVRVNEGRAGC